MPSTYNASKEQPSPVSIGLQRSFDFPRDKHLLVATPSEVYAWDSAGLHSVFQSRQGGIVAVREAKDGSGVLAVADKHVVVLHDTKRGQEQSWGLNADDDEVRHLEYTQDAGCLFLSTSLTNDIQRYSTQHSRLLSPSQTHHSAPVALAVSPTGHLLVSASDNPPAVYLRNLSHNSAPILIEPRASDTAVSVVAFHSERPNMFLLGFRDGTLAAFDATKASRKNRGSFTNQESVNDGEIARIAGLHRTVSKTVTREGISNRVASIAGAAFLQGYKSRAISIGSDGRCRLVDFANGGIILRTWHAKAPLTCVSVTSLRMPTDGDASTRRKARSDSVKITIGGPTSTNNLIAVGRIDGKVHIYDSVGLLLAQKNISGTSERIISIEWAKGPSPKSITHGGVRQDLSDAPSLPLNKALPSSLMETRPSTLGPANADLSPPKVPPKSKARTNSTPRGLGLPPALRRPDLSAQKRSARSNRQFTVHPDETAESTVKYTPSPKRTAAVTSAANNYVDLFSPVKPANAVPVESFDKRLSSTPKTRPRISSQTFVQDSSSKPNAVDTSASGQPTPVMVTSAEGHVISTDTGNTLPARSQSSPVTGVRRTSTHISPLKKRHISFKPAQRPSATGLTTSTGNIAVPNENAQVLAGLRRMSRTTGGAQHAVLSAFAAGPKAAEAKGKRTRHVRQLYHPPREGHARQRAWHPGNVLERESTWPTDSMQDASLHEDEDDIWFTSESDKEAKTLRRRRLAPLTRPPARQTSRSRVDSRGTFSTARQQSGHKMLGASPFQHLDGSTGDERFESARTHLSPGEAFSPSSADVRELFPRTSSLSPKRKRSPQKRLQQVSPGQRGTLREMAPNSVSGRPPKSPWDRAKGQKILASKPLNEAPQKSSNPPVQNSAEPGHMMRTPSLRCFDCAKTGRKLSALEEEVFRLKGEVLELKAALRRNGLPMPASLRMLR